MNTLVELLNAGPAQLALSEVVGRIGWALVHFLWQGAAIAGLLWLALRLLARRGPQARYAVACLALLLMAAAPVATFFVVQPAGQDVRRPAQTSAATYSEDDSWGKGTPLKVPAEFREGTATLEQAKAWCRALVVGSCLGNGRVIEVEHRELVPGGEQAVVVFDPSCGGSGGRGPQLIFSRTASGLQFLGDLSGSWRAAPPDALGRPRLVGYWRLGGGEGKASLIVLTSRGFVPVAHVDASGGDGAADEKRRTWRTLFEEPVSQKTLAATFGEDASSRTSWPDMEKEPELAATAKPVADDAAESGDGQHWTSRVFAWAQPAMPYAVAVWLAGVLACSVWHVVGWVRVQRLRRGAQPLADGPNERHWRAASGRLADAFGIRRAVRLLKLTGAGARDLAGPVVLGVLRPAVLIPAAVLTGLTPSQVEAVLAHELAHVRRHDYFVNLLQTLVETLLFYHPAVWWASARIRAERENCCDDLAVSAVGNSHAYAAALAALAEVAVAQQPARPAGLIGRLVPAARLGRSSADRIAPGAKTNLLHRIRRLLGIQSGPTTRWTSALAGALVLAVAVVGVVFYGCGSDPQVMTAKPVLTDANYPEALAGLRRLLGQSLQDGWELVVTDEGTVQPPGWPAGMGVAITLQPPEQQVQQPGKAPRPARLWIMALGYDGTYTKDHPGLPLWPHAREMSRWRARRVFQQAYGGHESNIHNALRATDDFSPPVADVPNTLSAGRARFNPRNGRIQFGFGRWWRGDDGQVRPLSLAARVEEVVTPEGRVGVNQAMRTMQTEPGESAQYTGHLVLDPAETGAALCDLRQITVRYQCVLPDRVDYIPIPLEPGRNHSIEHPSRLEVTTSGIIEDGDKKYIDVTAALHRGSGDAEIAGRFPTSHLMTYARMQPPPGADPAMTCGSLVVHSTIVRDDGETRIETCRVPLNPDECAWPLEAVVLQVPTGLRVIDGTCRLELEPSRLTTDPAFGTNPAELTWDQLMELAIAATDEVPDADAAQRLIELGEPAIPAVVRMLGRGLNERYATEILKRIGPPAVPHLLQGAVDGHGGRDGGTPAALLGTFGDRRVVPALIAIMRDGYVEPAPLGIRNGSGGRHAYTAYALGKLADPRAVDCLIEALDSDSPNVVYLAAWALGEIGEARAIEHLERLLDRPDPFTVVRGSLPRRSPDFHTTVRNAISDIRRFGPARLSPMPADQPAVWANPAPSVRARLAMVSARNQVKKLYETFPMLAEAGGAYIHIRRDDNGAPERMSFELTSNISRMGPQGPPTVRYDNLPHCVIRVSLVRAETEPSNGSDEQWRSYEIEGGTWISHVQVWSSDDRLKDAVENSVHEALSRFGGSTSHKLGTEPARRDVSIVNWIELVDKDDLPAGMYCRVPVYDTTDHPGAKWVYKHTLDAMKRAEAAGLSELSARLEGAYTAKGTLEIGEQFVQGDTITIRLRYIDEDKDIGRHMEAGNPVHVYGDKQFKSVYLWGHMPTDLPPGRYTVNLELDEYDRKDGRLVRAPFESTTRAVRRERLSCTYTVETAGAASRPATAQAGGKLPGSELTLAQAAGDKPLVVIGEALTEAGAGMSREDGVTVHRQEVKPWFALKGHLPQEQVEAERITVAYTVVEPRGERAIAKGRSVIWVLRPSPNKGKWVGVKALADTPENRRHMIMSLGQLPYPQVELKDALAQADTVAICKADDEGAGIVFEDGVTNYLQMFAVVRTLKGENPADKLLVTYTVVDRRDRPIAKGETIIWLLGKGEASQWPVNGKLQSVERRPGIKAVPDTPKNRRNMAAANTQAGTQPAAKRTIRIRLNPKRLAAMGLTVAEVKAALPESGTIDARQVGILGRLAIATHDGRAVLLQDVAEITPEQPTATSRPSETTTATSGHEIVLHVLDAQAVMTPETREAMLLTALNSSSAKMDMAKAALRDIEMMRLVFRKKLKPDREGGPLPFDTFFVSQSGEDALIKYVVATRSQGGAVPAEWLDELLKPHRDGFQLMKASLWTRDQVRHERQRLCQPENPHKVREFMAGVWEKTQRQNGPVATPEPGIPRMSGEFTSAPLASLYADDNMAVMYAKPVEFPRGSGNLRVYFIEAHWDDRLGQWTVRGCGAFPTEQLDKRTDIFLTRHPKASLVEGELPENWRDSDAPPATQPATDHAGPPMTEAQAMTATAELAQAIGGKMPANWEIKSRRYVKMAGGNWPSGQAVRIVLERRSPNAAEDLKKGRGGEVELAVMIGPFSRPTIPDMVSQAGNAPELGAWRGCTVFGFVAGGTDWPTAKADILAALKATDAPAAETQPAAAWMKQVRKALPKGWSVKPAANVPGVAKSAPREVWWIITRDDPMRVIYSSPVAMMPQEKTYQITIVAGPKVSAEDYRKMVEFNKSLQRKFRGNDGTLRLMGELFWWEKRTDKNTNRPYLLPTHFDDEHSLSIVCRQLLGGFYKFESKEDRAQASDVLAAITAPFKAHSVASSQPATQPATAPAEAASQPPSAPAATRPATQPVMSNLAKRITSGMPEGWELTGHGRSTPMRWSDDPALKAENFERLSFRHKTAEAVFPPGPATFTLWIAPAGYVGRAYENAGVAEQEGQPAALAWVGNGSLLFIMVATSDGSDEWKPVVELIKTLGFTASAEKNITPVAAKTAKVVTELSEQDRAKALPGSTVGLPAAMGPELPGNFACAVVARALTDPMVLPIAGDRAHAWQKFEFDKESVLAGDPDVRFPWPVNYTMDVKTERPVLKGEKVILVIRRKNPDQFAITIRPPEQRAWVKEAWEFTQRIRKLSAEEMTDQLVTGRRYALGEFLDALPWFRHKTTGLEPAVRTRIVRKFADEVRILQDGKQWETRGTLHDRHHLIVCLAELKARPELLEILERQQGFSCCAPPAMIDGVVACGHRGDAWLLARKIPEMRGDGGYVALHEAIQKLTGLKAEIPKATGNTNEAVHARDLAHARMWAEKLARAGIGTPDALHVVIDDTWDQLAVMLLKEGVLWYEYGPTKADKDTHAGSWRFLPAGEDQWVQLDIEQSMSQLRDLAVSPDRKRLAMLTAGEGHPILDIFDLPGLLEKRAAKPLHTVDPYPGGIWIIGWDRGNKLRVSSDMPLSRLARDENGKALPEPATDPVDMMMDKPAQYLLDLTTGKFTDAPPVKTTTQSVSKPAESQSATVLDDQQVEYLLKATSRPASTTTLTAPRVTLYGGSKAYIEMRHSSPASRPAPTSQPAKAMLDGERVDGLGKSLTIQHQAARLADLVGKAKPDFTFGDNGRDMMWIEGKDTDKPSFRLRRAFIYRPVGGEANFVLLNSTRQAGPPDDAFILVETSGPPTVAKLFDERPRHDGGSGDYALVKSRGPDGAVLYEIGWQSEYLARWAKQRRLYVLRTGDKWAFVGEGPAEGYFKRGSCRQVRTTVDARVEWTQTTGAPVRILFAVTETQSEWASSDMLQADPHAGDSMRDDLEKLREWVLQGKLPAALQAVSDRPYMLARRGENLEKLVRHLSSWTPGERESALKIQTVWKRELTRLNADLFAGEIPEGRRINLPTDAEMAKRISR